ncbi:cob(I)yrinic acid a,c-diamide adenosyltransferase [Patescibacteria group bacterium]|nr:cob(I)yrinic acid a,c-diamide adenosyltransferase [Patescibacteria group bacterium]
MKKTLGQIHIYSGNGKGKTTTGLGLTMRAIGADLKVALVFFDKGGDFYAERKVLTQLQKLYPKNFSWQAFGEVRMEKGKGFRFQNIPADLAQAQLGVKQVIKLLKQKFDLLILDEINTTVKTGLLKISDLQSIIDNKPVNTELVMTGRYCPPEIIKQADLVTEMQDIKHYAMNGVTVRPGIDY